MSETVLYDYWRSSASYRVRIALHLADVPFQSVPVDLLQAEHKAADHLARNPQGLVPALAIDGAILTQSLAILDYLAETHGLHLLPDDPLLRTKVRALAHSVAVDVHPVCNLSVVAYAAELAGDPQVKTAWMQRFIRPGLEGFAALLDAMPSTHFCAGDAPGLAEICLVPQLYNARRWGVPYDDLDRLSAIEAACADLPAFQAAHPDAVTPKIPQPMIAPSLAN